MKEGPEKIRFAHNAPPAEDARDAIALIATERERQIAMEGWSPEHDREEHSTGELATAAACYAAPGYTVTGKGQQVRGAILAHWPWDLSWWKPTPDDRIRELVKAGALIVAEIERLAAIASERGKGNG